MVRPYTSLAEGIELLVVSDQLSYCGARVRHREPVSDLAHNLVTFIAPSSGMVTQGK
jgi:hypothetical protein